MYVVGARGFVNADVLGGETLGISEGEVYMVKAEKGCMTCDGPAPDVPADICERIDSEEGNFRGTGRCCCW